MLQVPGTVNRLAIVDEEEDIPRHVGEMLGVCEGNHIAPIW